MGKAILGGDFIGQEAYGRDIGFKQKATFIWVSCPECGKLKWEHRSKYKKRGKATLCRSCSGTINVTSEKAKKAVEDYRQDKLVLLKNNTIPQSQVSAEQIVNAYLNKYIAMKESMDKLQKIVNEQGETIRSLSEELLTYKEKDKRNEAASKMQALVMYSDKR